MPEHVRGHHREWIASEYLPAPRNTGWTLASDVLAFPLWYLSIEHAVSYARWWSRVNGAMVEICDDVGAVTTVEFPFTADNPF